MGMDVETRERTYMVRLLRANWSLAPNDAGDGAIAPAGAPVHIEVDLVRNPEVCRVRILSM